MSFDWNTRAEIHKALQSADAKNNPCLFYQSFVYLCKDF